MKKLFQDKNTKRFSMLAFCAVALATSFLAAKCMVMDKVSALTVPGAAVNVSYDRVGTATDEGYVGWVKFRSGWSSPLFLVQPSSASNKLTAFCLDPGIKAPPEGSSYTVNDQTYEYEAVVKEDNDANNQIKLAVYMATAPSTDTATSAKMADWFNLDNISDYWKTDNDQGLNVTDNGFGMRNYKYIMFHALVGYINNINKPDGDPKKERLNSIWDYLDEIERNWITTRATELSTMIANNDEIWQTAKKYRLYGLDMSGFEADNVSVQDIAWIEPIQYNMATYAVDEADSDKYVEASDEAKILDHIYYCGEPSTSYTIKGTIMEKTGSNTGAALKINGETVTASIAVTSEESGCGTAEMTFSLDASTLAGKELVVFESLQSGDDVLTQHNDWSDSMQTINVISLDTDASDKADADKEILAAKDAVVTDNIKYCLVADTEYTIIGVLMNKETGEAVQVDGKTISNSTTITPKENCGEVDLDFEFDATELVDTKMVVFETAGIVVDYQLSDDDICLAYDIDGADGDPACSSYFHAVISHADLNDAAQTVTIVKAKKAPETGRFAQTTDSSRDNFNCMPIIIATIVLLPLGYFGIRMLSRKRFFGKNK